VRGTKVDLFTENEGLESEIVYAVIKDPKGRLTAASHGGVGRFDGKWWRFDDEGPLHRTARALIPRGDTLWVGTSAGVIGQGPTATRQIDARLGLASDNVLDLYLENDRRMWVLTDAGVSLLTL